MMKATRIQSFSDGVFAILITLLVLFIAAGLVAATATQRPARKEALRLALQGGAAMAAGIAGANALDRRDYGAAVLAVAVGAVGLSAINQLLSDSSSSNKEATDE